MVSDVGLHDGPIVRRVPSLSPLAVAPELHGRGVGGALVRAVVARTGEIGAPMVVLEGAPAYYRRFGFEPATEHGIHIDLPSWAPPEAAQVLRLDGYDATWRGRIVYPPAFDDVTEH
jgi:putative acetyltransferase